MSRTRRRGRRWPAHVTMWGMGAVVTWVGWRVGVHPVGAGVVGLVATMLIGGMLAAHGR